ncbi:hypothetical protein HII36_54595 [Nonomuraea sp. NN258]|uniref:hypothetical protein n=1 Tax=Nonomuraea antri TaxID=2730852 RepID=UPI001569AB1A|nr:hypothetical protein [Nonomuraea antri]NRQ40779.1 hypothetical protein [Nonomuraea antri]
MLRASVYTGPKGRLAFTLDDSRARDHQSAGGTLFGQARPRIGRLTALRLSRSADLHLFTLLLATLNPRG